MPRIYDIQTEPYLLDVSVCSRTPLIGDTWNEDVSLIRTPFLTVLNSCYTRHLTLWILFCPTGVVVYTELPIRGLIVSHLSPPRLSISPPPLPRWYPCNLPLWIRPSPGRGTAESAQHEHPTPHRPGNRNISDAVSISRDTSTTSPHVAIACRNTKSLCRNT